MNRAITLLCLLLTSQASVADTTCRFVTGGGVAFGPYDGLSSFQADTALNLLVTCDRKGGPQHISVTVGLGQGTHGTSVNARRMMHSGGSGDYLSYGLFRDVSRSSPWGFSPGIDTVTQTLPVPNNGSYSATFTIYGRIPAMQDVSTGAYSDMVQITLTP